jgi:cytochrome c556
MQRASDMREAATTLAKHAANRDYDRSKAALVDVTNTCNRCHQTFRVPVEIGKPPDEKGERKKDRDAE